MEMLQSAVLAALDPNSTEIVRQQATEYCQNIKTCGWKLCLSLFVENINCQTAVRFFCLQVLEDVVRFRYDSVDDSDAIAMRNALWDFIKSSHLDAEPVYVKNKLAVVIVLLFRYQYLTSWSTFFDDLLAIPDSLDFFLRICITLDEEIVATCRGQKEADMFVRIKDAMREKAVVQLTEAWISILSNYSAFPEIIQTCIRLFGMYVSWIDIKLVAQDRLLGILYSSLSTPQLRNSACDCFTEIISKGMKPLEKLSLIQGLNMADIISKLLNLSANEQPQDVEFDICVSKLVNITGLEICTSFENLQFSVDNAPQIFELLDRIFPSVLGYFAKNEEEICICLFPFLSSFLSILKRLKKTTTLQNIPIKEKIDSLLRVVVLKMRYRQDQEIDFESDFIDEDFLTFRKEMKTFFEAIAVIEPDMFAEYVSSAVISTFNAFTQPNNAVSWMDAELAIHLLFIYNESFKSPYNYTFTDSQMLACKTKISEMLSKLMISNISVFPHSSIPLIYFETITRHAQFFEEYPEFLANALKSFVDERGLHNSSGFIKNRVSYLFLRFVKPLKAHLKQYVELILTNIQDCLIVNPPIIEGDLKRPHSESSNDETKTDIPASAYDSQLFVFETVGKLISYEPVIEKQSSYLSVVVNPLVSQMQDIISRIGYTSPENQEINILHLHHLIVAVGSIGKGFPDFEYNEKSPNVLSPWTSSFKHAFNVILIILDRFSDRENIRDAVRYSLQRLLGCMGSDILSEILPVLKSGLLSSSSSKELVEFMSFVGVIIHKFKKSFSSILNEMIAPLRERTSFFLTRQTTGTDDVFEIQDLKRAYFTLFSNIFNSGLEFVLASESNLKILPLILQTVLKSVSEYNDMQTQRIACALVIKMVLSWGQDPETALPFAPGAEAEPKGNKKATKVIPPDSKKPPLPGFDQFIYQSIVPTLFELAFNKSLDLTDGQTLVFLSELSSLHRVIYQAQGIKYLNYLATVVFVSLNIPTQSSQNFINALSTMEPKSFKKFLQDFTVSLGGNKA